MKRIFPFVLVGIVVILIGYGLHNIDVKHNQLRVKTIELDNTEAKLKSLELQYQDLNKQLDTELQQKEQSKQQIDELEKKRQELEAQLQAKIKAKQDAQRAYASATLSQVASAQSGDWNEWARIVGIPESDWYFVNCVIAGCEGVSGEGGWNGVQRWNTAGSGAYGICQSLPASKMASAGSDYMTNPITQLRWCHSYAQGYGGWQQAWNFRKCVGSCYSTRTNSTVYKDHTWW